MYLIKVDLSLNDISILSGATLVHHERCLTEDAIDPEVDLAHQNDTSRAIPIQGPDHTVREVNTMDTVIEGRSFIAVTPAVPCPLEDVMLVVG